MQKQIQQECFAINDIKALLRSPAQEPIIILDVREQDEYAERHIPGAINISLRDLENRANELPKNRIIVTACGKGGGRSAQGAALLKQMGFNKANYLCGGTLGWFDV